MSTVDGDEFVPGMALSRLFYEQAVRPILAASFPALEHSAALIGPGSEVLGFDTPISADHHWGPRVMLFLSEREHAALAASVTRTLAEQLPRTFMGYPTNYGPPDEVGVQLLRSIDDGPINHRVELLTVRGFFSDYLGWDATAEPTTIDWLTFSEHRLRAVTSGVVFADPSGALGATRERLRWYPRDIWLYIMAAEWNRIADEEAFVGRCGDVGDELGSRLIVARIAHSLMRLAFLKARVYPPYSKWFGSAFQQLTSAPLLLPLLDAILNATTWREREAALSAAYGVVATLHNDLGITPRLDTDASLYHDRPYQVIHADRFAGALLAAINDESIRALPLALGSVNQWISSSNTSEDARLRAAWRAVYLTHAASSR